MTDLFNQAQRFIYRHARAIDVARFQYHFEGGNPESVLHALSAYQNKDGGFGHAMEADSWNPHSTPMHTCTAAGMIREIDVQDKNHPVIQGALRYLESGADFDGHFWACVVKTNDDYPHAPWWEMGSVSTCHQDYNPGAGLCGFLLRYGKQGSSAQELGLRIAKEAYQAYMQKDLLIDMHESTGYLQLLMDAKISGIPSTDEFDLEKLESKLRLQVTHSITKDKKAWENQYICRPSQFIRDKNSVFYQDNTEITEYECEFLIRTQQEDGGWPVHWRWNAYPDEWAISKNWWRGSIAVDNLIFLRRMGKL